MSHIQNVSTRRRTLLAGAFPLMVVIAMLFLPTIPGTDIDLTVPYAAEGKGPTYNTLGEIDGVPVVDIEGAPLDETTGNLNMTTVAVRTHMTLGQLLSRWITTDDTIVPIEEIFPSGMSQQEVEERQAVAFSSSESLATMSAMRHLNKPIETMVVNISEGSPAQKLIKVNDVILAVGEKPISTPVDLVTAVQEHKPGETVTLKIKRQEKEEQVDVTLAGRETQGKQVAFLGVTALAQPAGNIRVTYNLNDVGGPSAGLMFALAVVDKLSPGQLTGGKFIAGTGTIDAEGTVGPIGGIKHKIAAAKDAGAQAFLVPAANCPEALTAKHPPVLIKVNNLSDAVENLEKFSAGHEVATCSK